MDTLNLDKFYEDNDI